MEVHLAKIVNLNLVFVLKLHRDLCLDVPRLAQQRRLPRSSGNLRRYYLRAEILEGTVQCFDMHTPIYARVLEAGLVN